MSIFKLPIIEIVEFECGDVITTSTIDVDDSGFNNQVVKP